MSPRQAELARTPLLQASLADRRTVALGSYRILYNQTSPVAKPPLVVGCGIRSRAEDNHAYSEGRRRSPEEYEGILPSDKFIR